MKLIVGILIGLVLGFTLTLSAELLDCGMNGCREHTNPWNGMTFSQEQLYNQQRQLNTQMQQWLFQQTPRPPC